MTGRRSTHRADGNQQEIVDGLRALGASVWVLSQAGGHGPDACIGWQGENILMEFKQPGGKLSPEQAIWHYEWRGQVAVVHSFDEAVAALNAAVRKR